MRCIIIPILQMMKSGPQKLKEGESWDSNWTPEPDFDHYAHLHIPRLHNEGL